MYFVTFRINSLVNDLLNQEMFRIHITVFENTQIEEMSNNLENISDIWNLKKSRHYRIKKKMNIRMLQNLDILYSTSE